MACFAAPYGLRYATHCFNRAHAQNKRPALIPTGGKLGVTSPLENAVKVIERGHLLPRSEITAGFVDVANQGALNNNLYPHDYVRLYFRPRNGFHLRTEGIKTLDDPYRQENHMSVPVMFVFPFTDIISKNGVKFSSENMANTNPAFGDDDNFFSSIPFQHVYHDAPISDPNLGREIRNRRMSEVLVPEGLEINEKCNIVCRTDADRSTLIHYLQMNGIETNATIGIEQTWSSTFFHKGMYIKEILFDSHRGTLHLSIKLPERLSIDNLYRIDIEQIHNEEIICSFDDRISISQSGLRIVNFNAVENCEWKVLIESSLAHHSVVVTNDFLG